jgi:hypothetical protein
MDSSKKSEKSEKSEESKNNNDTFIFDMIEI